MLHSTPSGLGQRCLPIPAVVPWAIQIKVLRTLVERCYLQNHNGKLLLIDSMTKVWVIHSHFDYATQ